MRTFLCVAVLTAASCAAWSQGVERWPIKTSVPDGTSFSKPDKVAIGDLLALPDAPGVVHNDKRYQSARIPAKAGDKFPEGKLVTTTGWLYLVGGEGDGDYHIQISGSASTGDHCLIVEVPNPDPKFTASTDLRPKFAAVREFIKAKMLAGKDPSTAGSVMTHPVPVTVTGILFYDDSHVGTPPRGKKGMKAATLWELHPVTAIAFAPKPK
ncbi:MAG: hypothetical protein NTW28_04460 [Candidatus Solibacter sp.]|nr:hypothetical protein [Candidatus Solibacter sp.]